MRRCPNCGAYVMSDDNICPRCDHPLNRPAAQVDPAADISDSPAPDEVASTADPATGVSDSPDSGGAEIALAESTAETPVESDTDIDAETGPPGESGPPPAEDHAVDRAELPTTRLPER